METTTEKAAAESPAPVFSFVLPVYNEAVSLGAVHTRLAAAGGALGEPFEIIYADDGSTDGTDALLDGLADIGRTGWISNGTTVFRSRRRRSRRRVHRR